MCAWGRRARRGRTREAVGCSRTNSAGILCGGWTEFLQKAGPGPHSMHGGVTVLTGWPRQSGPCRTKFYPGGIGGSSLCALSHHQALLLPPLLGSHEQRIIWPRATTSWVLAVTEKQFAPSCTWHLELFSWSSWSSIPSTLNILVQLNLCSN